MSEIDKPTLREAVKILASKEGKTWEDEEEANSIIGDLFYFGYAGPLRPIDILCKVMREYNECPLHPHT